MERGDIAQPEASRLAPPKELPHRPPVRRPRPRVCDPPREELQEPRHRRRPRVDDHLRQDDLPSPARRDRRLRGRRHQGFRRHSVTTSPPPAQRPTERLEPPQVVPESLGQHVEPGLLEFGDQARASLLLDAEGSPAAALLQEPIRGSVFWLPTNSAPKFFMTAAPRTLPTPKSRSISPRVSRVRSSSSGWLMASGGWRGAIGISQAPSRSSEPGGRPRLVGCTSGGGGSGTAGGHRLAAAGGRGRGDLDGQGAAGAARAAEGRGEFVDVGRQISAPTRRRRKAETSVSPRSRPRGRHLESAPAPPCQRCAFRLDDAGKDRGSHEHGFSCMSARSRGDHSGCVKPRRILPEGTPNLRRGPRLGTPRGDGDLVRGSARTAWHRPAAPLHRSDRHHDRFCWTVKTVLY